MREPGEGIFISSERVFKNCFVMRILGFFACNFWRKTELNEAIQHSLSHKFEAKKTKSFIQMNC